LRDLYVVAVSLITRGVEEAGTRAGAQCCKVEGSVR
jgi:hypothetical protein